MARIVRQIFLTQKKLETVNLHFQQYKTDKEINDVIATD
jgi:hypothetical protein